MNRVTMSAIEQEDTSIQTDPLHTKKNNHVNKQSKQRPTLLIQAVPLWNKKTVIFLNKYSFQ